ncbi:universal stress protein [Rodentibacter trehalosifermentans]|uniref:Universal stress protein UspA n=1 Tax=Rodentibacter trehalosifermentans TaxID=1908263 RepID=A0A1V3IWU7_9PAST|nr:universal stress protein [Rodentibacter trehalosifermentans]OOF46777.1 universal stress protein UspA [Rodentibacter trehalosifermentans]OOF49590.1 universal stress protein UspA [Rodentibacter trehalosifermentans]OOF53437.1 universal stress protein UspA [Rodentibacter trehalosifermentans]
MYNNLLLVIDLNNPTTAKTVVDNALQLTANNPKAVYRVVTIVEPVDDSFISAFLPKNFDKSLIEEVKNALHHFTEAHFPPSAKVQHIVAHGTIYEEIIRIAEEKAVDLIVMLASSKPSVQFSNNTRRVAKYGKKPMLILK